MKRTLCLLFLILGTLSLYSQVSWTGKTKSRGKCILVSFSAAIDSGYSIHPIVNCDIGGWSDPGMKTSFRFFLDSNWTLKPVWGPREWVRERRDYDAERIDQRYPKTVHRKNNSDTTIMITKKETQRTVICRVQKKGRYKMQFEMEPSVLAQVKLAKMGRKERKKVLRSTRPTFLQITANYELNGTKRTSQTFSVLLPKKKPKKLDS